MAASGIGRRIAGGEGFDAGFVDVFRHLYPGHEAYSWWSNRGAAREKDVGWRIDYHICTEAVAAHARVVTMLDRHQRFSDHTPVIADFDLDAFRHLAFYDEREGRMEMHLQSGRAQTVRLDGLAFPFTRGETIHTENSYKYEVGEFLALAGEAGFRPLRTWTDPQDLFSIHYLRVG